MVTVGRVQRGGPSEGEMAGGVGLLNVVAVCSEIIIAHCSFDLKKQYLDVLICPANRSYYVHGVLGKQ